MNKFMRLVLTSVAALVMSAGAAFALDVNKASQAELEAVNGIGPVTAQKIIDERGKGPFKSIQDLQDRVDGVGPVKAAALAEGSGLKAGTPKAADTVTKATKGAESKVAAKQPASEAPSKVGKTATAPDSAKTAKADAKAAKATAKKAKADEKLAMKDKAKAAAKEKADVGSKTKVKTAAKTKDTGAAAKK